MCENRENYSAYGENEKLVSVIVPVYNVELYLEKCVDSIRRQTYRNLEIILVDDGTEDASNILCDVYGRIDNRIKVIHKKNGGLSDARNAGLDAANGEYIAFVDGDDFIHPQMYETMVHMIQKEESDMVFCSFKQVDEEAEIDPFTEVIDCSPAFFTGKQMQRMYFSYEYDKLVVVAWNKLYKASVFEKVRFPTGQVHEDESTTFLLTYPCKKVSFSPTPFYYYVNRKESITRKFNEKRFDLLKSYILRMEYYARIKEYEFSEAFAVRYMRMTNQYRMWCEELQQDYSEKFKECRKYFVEMLYKGIADKKIKFDIFTNVELLAYMYMNDVYYKVWRWRR